MSKRGYVYIMANKSNSTIYVGVTSDLEKRVYEHKNKVHKGFTAKYNVDKLVYFEETSDMVRAIQREKQLKNWKREWKNKLVEEENPDWNDLSETYFDSRAWGGDGC